MHREIKNKKIIVHIIILIIFSFGLFSINNMVIASDSNAKDIYDPHNWEYGYKLKRSNFRLGIGYGNGSVRTGYRGLVANRNTNVDYFIPTRTWTELKSMIDHPPANVYFWEPYASCLRNNNVNCNWGASCATARWDNPSVGSNYSFALNPPLEYFRGCIRNGCSGWSGACSFTKANGNCDCRARNDYGGVIFCVDDSVANVSACAVNP